MIEPQETKEFLRCAIVTNAVLACKPAYEKLQINYEYASNNVFTEK